MARLEELDPVRILLNIERFRGKFHIYEIAQSLPSNIGNPTCIVRKQLLSTGSTTIVNCVRTGEQHVEIEVERQELSHIYELVRNLSIPASRKAGRGKDGTNYALQTGIRPCSTTIRWWSDSEPELSSLYALRDAIVKTVKHIVRSKTDSGAT